MSELVELLPPDWVLIGGLMVQLHALERGVTDVRATEDVDVLGRARPQGALEAIDGALRRADFDPLPPDLIEARSLLVHRDPDAQREDLLRLLSLIEDPRAAAAEMRGKERSWLRNAEARLRLDEPSTLSGAEMRRARQAFRLLLTSA